MNASVVFLVQYFLVGSKRYVIHRHNDGVPLAQAMENKGLRRFDHDYGHLIIELSFST